MFSVRAPAPARRHAGPGIPPHSAGPLRHLRRPGGHRDHHPGGDTVVSLGGGTSGGDDRAPPSGPAPAPAEGPGRTSTCQAIELSTDFKPILPAERQRIESAGRQVTVTEARGNIPRIDDGIAISRTIGDLAYKNNNRLPAEQQALTALPEVRTANITRDTLFLIIACDGICISCSTMSLSEPVTEKATEGGGNARLDYDVSAMQGYHLTMEDAHTAVLDLDARTATSFFGVYDGHGGPAVSKYCTKHLHTELRKNAQFRRNPADAIRETFLRMDVKMRHSKAGKELSKYGGNEYWDEYGEAIHARRFLPFCGGVPYDGLQQDGCTACVVLIRGSEIIVGIAGDSRCVLSRNNQAIELSTDFKPNLTAERQRIEAAGYQVTVTAARGNIPRIDDGIAVSRTIGDLAYKNNNRLPAEQQALTALPELRTANITHDTQFLIIACDGIWDCMASQQTVEFVGSRLNDENVGLAFICEAILDNCLAHQRGRDNMTIMLVRFKTPGSAGQAAGSQGDQSPPAAATGGSSGSSS